jgi:hypothetical protein
MSTINVMKNSPLTNENSQYDAYNSILRQVRSASNHRVNPRIMISDLKYGPQAGPIEILVLRKYPGRKVKSARWNGLLAAACARDESGMVGLVLWGDQVDRVRTGDVVRIENGWCRMSLGQKVVSTGRTGRLSVIAS